MSPAFRKTITAALAALTLGTAAIATASSASAGYYRSRNYAGYAAAGIIGGLALGALAASAARPAYAGDDCYRVRQRVWIDGYGYGYRRVTVCE